MFAPVPAHGPMEQAICDPAAGSSIASSASEKSLFVIRPVVSVLKKIRMLEVGIGEPLIVGIPPVQLSTISPANSVTPVRMSVGMPPTAPMP